MTSRETSTISSYRIAIGRRIQELLEERGAAYLVGFFANRIRFDPHRLVKILQADLTPTAEDLQQIAKGLGISVERLTQQDTLERTYELHERLLTMEHAEANIVLAEELAAVALGATERCDAWHNLGKAYYRGGRMEDAHQAFLKTYSQYEQVMDRYQDYERLFRFIYNLIVTYTMCEDYKGLADVLARAEGVTWEDPIQAGSILFACGVVQYELGSINSAKERFVESLNKYRQSNNDKLIGRAEYNVGHVEYLTGEYQLACSYLEAAVEHLVGDHAYFGKAVEHLVKCLIQLGELARAEELLTAQEATLRHRPQDLAMLHLQLAYKLGDPDRLVCVLEMDIVEKPWKALGYKYLAEYYAKQENALAVLHFFRLYLQVDTDPSSFENLMQQRRE